MSNIDRWIDEPEALQRVSGVGSLTWKYKVEDAEPDGSEVDTDCYFEQLTDGSLEITIQQTKPGGRTYKHKAKVQHDHLEYLLRLMTA